LFIWELRIEGASEAAARTAVTNVIVLVEIAYLFSCRSLNHSILVIGLFTNKLAIAGSLTMLGAQLLFTYAPVMNNLFHTAPIDAGAWLRIAGVAAVAFLAVELEKWIRFGGGRGQPTKDQPSDPERRKTLLLEWGEHPIADTPSARPLLTMMGEWVFTPTDPDSEPGISR
jgi:magnesium-transporting ATPase (P-type)